MPELPEVEHLRRSLEPHLVGARVMAVRVWRRDIVRVAGTRKAVRGVKPAMLLQGDRIAHLIRRGKSMAIVGEAGGVLGVHLGMTGMMRILGTSQADSPQRTQRARSERNGAGDEERDRHVHCEWTLVRERDPGRRSSALAPQRPWTRLGSEDDAPTRLGSSHLHLVRDVGGSTLITDGVIAPIGQPFALWFRDPRRFGGLYPFASIDELHAHAGGWARLGPDALEIDPGILRERLRRTTQPIKAALLNQALIAGVGNIYADESLFASGIHPKSPPKRIGDEQWTRLAESIVRILRSAIDAGGSSISDYLDAQGEPGKYGGEHRVYGRGGQPCALCSQPLCTCVVGQRTTVFCERCQPRRRKLAARRGVRASPGSCPQRITAMSGKRSAARAAVV